jgi:hypothetical protein
MALNIKSKKAEAAIRALAAATGEGITETVEKAVQEKLDRLSQRRQAPETGADLLARIQPLLDALAAKRTDFRSSKELLDELYDEDGLPR